MAVTVEELQIILSCDATTAEAVLQKIQTTVQAFVDKISGPLSSIGEKTGQAAKEINRQFSGIGKGNPLDSVSATPVEKAAKAVTTVGKELDSVSEKARKAMDSFKGDIDGDGFTKQEVTAERLAAAYKRLSVLRDKYDTEVEKNGADSAKAVSIEGSIASTKNQIVTLTEQLEKLRTKFSEVRSEAEGLSGIDWSQVTITGDTGQQHSDKPIVPQYQPEPFQPYTATGNDPAVFMQTQVDNMSQSVARMVELAGEARAKIEDAFSGGDIDAKLASNLSLAERKIRELANQLQSVSEAKGADSGAALSVEGKLQSAINKADTLLAKLEKIRSQSASVPEESQAPPASTLPPIVPPDSGNESMVSMIGSGIKLSSVLKQVGSIAASVGAKIRKAFQSSHISKFTSRIGRMIQRMLTMRLLRSVLNGVSQGFENLAKSSASTAEAMNSLKMAGSAIGVSLASAVMPIIKALISLFYQVAAAAAAAANAIAAFFAAITGQGRFTAISMKKNMSSIEKSAGGGGGAIKGLLADFDELNIIASEAGGGGGGGIDSMFETTDDTILPDWAERIKAAIEAGDWAGAASILTDKLNKFISSVDWAGIGANFGEKANNVLTFINSAVDTFDWANLGASISTFFNNVASNVSGENIGGILVAGWNAAIGVLTGFFDTLDLSAVSAKVETAFATASRKLNLSDAIRTIGNIFKTAIQLAASAVNGVDWGKVGRDISKGLKSIDWEGIFSAVGDLIGGFVEGIGDAILGIFDGAFNGILKKVEALFGLIGIYFGNALAGLFDVLGQLLSKAWSAIKFFFGSIAKLGLEAISTLVDKAAEQFGNVAPWLNDFSSSLHGVIDDLTESLTQAKDDLSTPIDFEVITRLDPEAQRKADEYRKTLSQSITMTVNVKYVENNRPAGPSAGGRYVTPFASGGLVYGDTLARIGEYPGARNNPEVVAPLSDLRGILRGTGTSDGMTRTQADTMIGLLRQVAAKDLTIGPSADLGQVVTQSLEAYGTV